MNKMCTLPEINHCKIKEMHQPEKVLYKNKSVAKTIKVDQYNRNQ